MDVCDEWVKRECIEYFGVDLEKALPIFRSKVIAVVRDNGGFSTE